MTVSPGDLERSYQGTYLGLRVDGSIIPVLVASVQSSRVPTFSLSPLGEGARSVEHTSPDLVYDYPDLGFVLHRGDLYWLERKPYRQWHKGVKTSLVEVFANGRGGRTLSDMPESFRKEALVQAYNKSYSGSILRTAAIHKEEYWYSGSRVCRVGELDSIPEELSYIKKHIQTLFQGAM